jgi:hypothetical protein
MIEVWHRVLKTGCRIESRQSETADRLRVALTLFSIIAWRVLYATMLSRTAPDLPCTALLATEEWQALYCHAYGVAVPPQTPPSLRQTVSWIAQIGGFLARKNDDPQALKSFGAASISSLISLTSSSSCVRASMLWV